MDRAERLELMRQLTDNPDDLSPEVRASMAETRQYVQDKTDRGEVLESWSKDNFPIGLDSNMEPFPLTKQPGETTDDSAEAGPNPTTH